jgi:tetrahydromethanopterin S-methyltransferase subunit G
MTEEQDKTASILIEYMRHFDARQSRFEDDVREMKPRLSSIDEHLANIRGEMASIHQDIAIQNRRLDRLDSRLDTLERLINISRPAQG